MKKLILTSVAAAFLMAGFTSCKKDYTCHCQKTSSAGEDHFTVTAKKREANNVCESFKTSNPSYYSSCEIE